MNHNKVTSPVSLVLVVYLAGLLFILAANNLDYRGMWWDEAAQFWISQGLSNYAEPHSNPAGLDQVVAFNRRENLDPGGFSILLHVWTKPGTGLSILRSLPFTFLLVAMGSLGLLAWRWTRNSLFAVGACALPLCYPGISYFAFEIRAFSMEMAGIAVCTLMFARLLDKQSIIHALLLGSLSAVFMSSRYSFVLFNVALGLAYFASHQIAGQRWDRAARRRYTLFGLLVVLAGLACVEITLRHQLWAEMRTADFGITAPIYTQSSTLRGNENLVPLIARNTYSLAAVPITAAMVWLLFARRVAYRRLKNIGGQKLAAIADRRFVPVLMLIVLLQALSMLASLVGVYPWDIASRWSAYLLMLSAISLVAIVAEVLQLLQSYKIVGRKGTVPMRGGVLLTTLFLLGVLSFATVNAWSHRNDVEGTYRANIALQLDQLPIAELSPGSVFVAHYEIPMLRYLYEHGPYAGRPEYPGLFRFESNQEFRDQIELDASAEGLTYIVSAFTPGQLSRRFRAYRFVPVNGTRLRRIVCRETGADGHCD